MPSRKSRSSRSARRRAASLRARRSPRNKLGQFVPHRSVSKRKSRSASKSKSSRRSRRSRSASLRARRSPRNKLGQFVRRRPAVRKSKSRSRSTKSKSRSRSVKGRLSLKEQKALARRMGGNLKHMQVTSRPGGRRRLSESLAQKEKRERAALRRRRASKLADISFARVLKHFGEIIPEQGWCPKRDCAAVYQKHKQLGILPKSVADLNLILSFPSESEGVNARCWICLYRTYRDLYHKVNGVYPDSDVSGDLAKSKTQAFKETSSEEVTVTRPKAEAFMETSSEEVAITPPLGRLLALPPASPQVEDLGDSNSEKSLVIYTPPSTRQLQEYLDDVTEICTKLTKEEVIKGEEPLTETDYQKAMAIQDRIFAVFPDIVINKKKTLEAVIENCLTVRRRLKAELRK